MMQTKHALINYIAENPDNCGFYYDRGDGYLHNKDSKERICTLDSFWDEYSKKYGLSFECIYDEHVFCSSVIRCTECCTVIFYMYDESIEPNFSCPVCTDVKTEYEFWTKEDIDNDPMKQQTIDSYIAIGKHEKECEERIKRRNGKRDDQLLSRRLRIGAYSYKIDLQCNNIMDNPIKGLRLSIEKWEPDGDNSYTFIKEHIIPLGITTFRNKLKLRKLLHESDGKLV